MRNAISFFFLITIMLIFIACEPAFAPIPFSELMDDLISVDLINYDNPDAKKTRNHPVKPFEFDRVFIIETLRTERTYDFINELSLCTPDSGLKHHDSPNGVSIRIHYSNGDFFINSLHCDYVGFFYKNGQVRRFVGTNKSDYLRRTANKYFDTQIK